MGWADRSTRGPAFRVDLVQGAVLGVYFEVLVVCLNFVCTEGRGQARRGVC
jgi:hypothetical protein